jgi:hypothetical protein
MSVRKRFQRVGSVIAFGGSSLQIAVVLGILFLPIVLRCDDNGSCLYTQLIFFFHPDATWLSYALIGIELILVLVPNIMASIALRRRKLRPLRAYCWLAAITSLFVAYANWIFGWYFLPGALLLITSGVLLIFAGLGNMATA